MLNNEQQLFFPTVLIKFWISLVQGLTDFQDTVYDEFVTKLKAAVEKNMVLGNGLEAGINQVRIHERQQSEFKLDIEQPS